MKRTFSRGIKVAGRAVEHWGGKSISTYSAALFELVKNSRDADATQVTIEFDSVSDGSGSITVRDNGTGMTEADVVEKWLTAGTTSKLKNTRSNGGRRVWGEMGIGRFACEKIGRRVRMISMPKGSREKVVMDFDWEQYKKDGVTFDSVTHDGYVETRGDSEGPGLVLVIEGLWKGWKAGKISKIKDDLGKYMLPKDLTDEKLEIRLIAKEYGIDDVVEPTIGKAAPFVLDAEFDGKDLHSKITDMRKSEAKVKEEVVSIAGDKECGPFSLHVSFYPFDRAGDATWEKYYRKHKVDVQKLKSFLSDHAGIYLYRDDVWMKPYGGKNDWIGLESRKIARRTNIGRNQVYGSISISKDDNPDIAPTANREALQENQALADLRGLVLDKAIVLLERYREAARPAPVEKPTKVLARNSIASASKLLKGRTELARSEISQLSGYLDSTKKYIGMLDPDETQDADGSALRDHELNVMSLGIATSYVAHEIAESLDSSWHVVQEMRKTMDNLDFSSVIEKPVIDQGFAWMETLEANTSRISHFLSFVNDLSSHISVSKSTGGKTSQVKGREMWDTVTNGLMEISKDVQFDYEEDPDGLTMRINRIDLESVMMNLLTNALEALKQAKPGDGRILCRLAYEASDFVMEVSDNGIGVKPENKEKIFEPFFTTSTTGTESMSGHGLGLAIVKEILDRHGGSIAVESPGRLECGSTFRVAIPSSRARRVG